MLIETKGDYHIIHYPCISYPCVQR